MRAPPPPPAASIIRAAEDGGGQTSALNLGVSFENVTYTGRISSSKASHTKKTITPSEYNLIGIVTNEAQAGINNGVSVTLAGSSSWTVTGTSYINSLTLEGSGSLSAVAGKTLKITNDGEEVTHTTGTITGNIVITIE
jgi:hypothetical protein